MQTGRLVRNLLEPDFLEVPKKPWFFFKKPLAIQFTAEYLGISTKDSLPNEIREIKRVANE